MAWRIEFDERALKDLRKLDKQTSLRITSFLRERIALDDDPRRGGVALRGRRSGTSFWRYRVGDWRIVVHIDDAARQVLVIRVAHRRQVYRGLFTD